MTSRSFNRPSRCGYELPTPGDAHSPRVVADDLDMHAAEPIARDEQFRDELVERALTLPVGDIPALLRVAELCGVPTATPQLIALEAAKDESFSALLLRKANSAASYSATHIADLPTAVSWLGYRRVAALALAAPGLYMLDRPADGLEAARHELHRHAIRVGLAARALAPPAVDRERALAAGLLHNLGLHVIAAYAPDEFRYLLDAPARDEQFWEAEDWIFGFSHADLGASLAQRWSYPLDLVTAIRDHDSPVPETALGALVQVSDVLVRSLGIGIEPERELPVGVATVDLAAARATVVEVVAAQDRFDAAPDGCDPAPVPT
jgi:HD-like signal output (HDOD) protein